MKNQVLIGESGGSKTDWVLKNHGEVVWQFSGESLHPKNWNTELFNDLLYDFLGKQLDFKSTILHFFGAGCNGNENSKKLYRHFSLFGFQSVNISGDLQAAGLATLGDKNGFVAILGSGSVLIHFENQNVAEFFGGFGRENGDEGAGYYFGKLVLSDFINDKLEPLQISILKSVLSIQEVATLKRKELQDSICLELSKRLSDNILEFQNYHFQNIDLFYTKYVQPNMDITLPIHFVGSYAYFHQEIIKSYFRAKAYQTGKFVARPIEKLIELF